MGDNMNWIQEFVLTNFFSIICTIAAFGITYILKNISTAIKELQEEYKRLAENRHEMRNDLQRDISEIKELIAGQYVRKSELPNLVKAELFAMQQHEYKGG